MSDSPKTKHFVELDENEIQMITVALTSRERIFYKRSIEEKDEEVRTDLQKYQEEYAVLNSKFKQLLSQ